METDTYSDIVAAAEYGEARMHLSNDLHGRAENPDDLDPVPASCACPKCGERDVERLWIGDRGETVTCATCGTVYDIGPEAQLERADLGDDNFYDRYALAHPGALM